MNKSSQENVIFFDGHCGLCNGFVDFIIKRDRRRVFHYSTLQSEYAKTHLPEEFTRDLTSVVVRIGEENIRKARAVAEVFRRLGPPWSTLAVLGVLPSSVLNFGYDLVATHRYRIFGKRETCRLPTPEERQLFIL